MIDATTSTLVIASLFLLAAYLYRNHAVGSGGFATDKDGKPLVGPATLPFIGSLALFLQGTSGRYLEFCCETQARFPGKTWSLTLPFTPRFVITCNPQNVEHILKTNFEGYVKGKYAYDILKELLGDGIFNADGETWRVQRKTASHIFNVKNFRDFFFKVFKEEAVDFLDVLHAANKNKRVLDLSNLFFRYTLDSFMHIGFGTSLNCLKAEKDVPFAVAFDSAQLRINDRFFEPMWKIMEPITSVGSKFQNDIKTIHDFSLKIIKDRRQDVGVESKEDLLSRFMCLKNENGSALSDEELSYVVLNFIIAGRDTTAQALAWCFYCLARNPAVEKALYDEIVSVFGKSNGKDTRNVNNMPTYEQIKNLKYANAVFSETLRLYPSVPKNMKIAVHDDVWPDGTHIKAGNCAIWIAYTMGRLPEIWGPDADEFKPERWLTGEVVTPFKYPAFHAGPRTCLGQNMALLEGVFVIVLIVREFKLKLDPNQEVLPNDSVTLPMMEGLRVFVEARE